MALWCLVRLIMMLPCAFYSEHIMPPLIRTMPLLDNLSNSLTHLALSNSQLTLFPAAINRLDGRQYAVKKIPLETHSSGAFERIMREVTTLSRLQHANVVRYYQAW